jgi:hypothetical protein
VRPSTKGANVCKRLCARQRKITWPWPNYTPFPFSECLLAHADTCLQVVRSCHYPTMCKVSPETIRFVILCAPNCSGSTYNFSERLPHEPTASSSAHKQMRDSVCDNQMIQRPPVLLSFQLTSNQKKNHLKSSQLFCYL